MATKRTAAAKRPRATPKQRAVEALEEVARAPLEPALPIRDDVLLTKADPDLLEVLDDTQTLAAETTDGELVDEVPDDGDEAFGDSPATPDQNVVENLGRAAGITYQDNEPLAADDKVAARDAHRWEDDPASAEDYEERQVQLNLPAGRPAKRRP